jgi:hypothetical protein
MQIKQQEVEALGVVMQIFGITMVFGYSFDYLSSECSDPWGSAVMSAVGCYVILSGYIVVQASSDYEPGSACDGNWFD